MSHKTLQQYKGQMHILWNECVEKFCRSIGINESNAHQVSLEQIHPPECISKTFVSWNGVRVGEITARIDCSSGNGLRYYVSARTLKS